MHKDIVKLIQNWFNIDEAVSEQLVQSGSQLNLYVHPTNNNFFQPGLAVCVPVKKTLPHQFLFAYIETNNQQIAIYKLNKDVNELNKFIQEWASSFSEFELVQCIDVSAVTKCAIYNNFVSIKELYEQIVRIYRKDLDYLKAVIDQDPTLDTVYSHLDVLASLDKIELAKAKYHIKQKCSKINLNDLMAAVREIRSSQEDTLSKLIQLTDGYYIEKRDAAGFRMEKISNFILRPLEVISLQDDELVRVQVVIDAGADQLTCDLSRTDLIGWKDLIRKIPSSRTQWLAGDREVQLLRGLLTGPDVPVRRGVDKIGIYDNQFVSQHGVWDENGPVEHPDVVYIKQNVGIEREFEIKHVDNWKEHAKEVMQLLPKIHHEHSIWPILGWFFATPFAPVCQKRLGHFPLLQVWGTKGAGKSSCMTTLWRVWGVSGEPRSSQRTTFSFIKELSSTNIVPILLDEYKPSEIPDTKLDALHYMLKLAYNGAAESRGRADQSTVEYYLTAPVAVIGEMPFTDPALLERIILVNLKSNYVARTPQAQKTYAQLNSMQHASFLPAYIQWCFSLDDWGAQIEASIEHVKNLLKNKNIYAPLRIVDNLGILRFGLMAYVDFARFVGAKLPKIDLDQILLCSLDTLTKSQSLSALDRFMMHFNTMVARDIVELNKEYVIENDKLLFATETCIALYSQFCNQYGYKTDFPGREALRQQIIENHEMGGYITHPFGKAKWMNGINKSVRCTEVDLHTLEQTTGIPVDTWITVEPITQSK